MCQGLGVCVFLSLCTESLACAYKELGVVCVCVVCTESYFYTESLLVGYRGPST